MSSFSGSQRHLHVAAAFIFTLFTSSLYLAAQSSPVPSYRAGLKSIVIPAPADLIEMGPDYRVVLEPLAPNSNRLVAAFLKRDDLSAIQAGHRPPMSTYALVDVARRLEFSSISADIFKRATEEMAQQFATNLGAVVKRQQDEVNSKIKAVNPTPDTVVFDKPVPLGQLFCKVDACAFGAILPVTEGGVTKNLVKGTVLLRVQDRLLYAYLTIEYKDQESVQWVSTTEEQWADAILKANAK